ncbi:MAG: flagellar basal-body MS-ring/collar protein FliF [Burkholderiales bacterium]
MASNNANLLSAFTQLPIREKLGLLTGFAALAAIGAASWMWSSSPEYRVLYSNLSDRDGGAVIASLNQMNIPYKFSETGGAIMVPSAQVHDARLRVASLGLPKGSLVGFESMDSQKFGLTQFQEQINYQRALEGELSRSIQSLAAVQGARVHLAIPKPSVFLREQNKPTASVLLSLHSGKTLERSQVAGIVHLISSSVPELSPKGVSVLDQAGNLLSARNDSGLDLDPAQLAFVQQIELNHARRIQEILEPVVGRGNVHAQVTADVDFSLSESTAETYRPNQASDAATVRNQQINESGNGATPIAQGVPGAASNQPGTPIAGASSLTSAAAAMRKESNIQYEVDRTVRHVRQPVGSVKRLSAAVVINHRKSLDAEGKSSFTALSPDEMTQLTALAKEAMGFNTNRGDSVNVANTAFNNEEREALPEIPLWQQPENISLAKEIGKSLAIAGLILYLLFGVVKPFFRQLNDSLATPPAETLIEALPAPSGAQADGLQNPLDTARALAKQDPKIVASVVRNWVAKE